MAGLTDLPHELFCLLLTFLPKRALSTLSFTSKHHRALVEPELYREIRWDEKNHPRRDHNPPFHLLFRSLLNRPELASYIYGLEICCRKPYHAFNSYDCIWRKTSDTPEFTTSDMEQTTSLIHSLHLGMEDKWIPSLKRGAPDLFIALIIWQSTNLRYVALDNDYMGGTPFIGDVLEKAAATNSFCFLKSIEYSNDLEPPVFDSEERQEKIDFRQIMPLFSIPSLTRLSMSLPSRNISWLSPVVPTSALTSLHLDHCQISEQNLGILLHATPCLKWLEYNAWINVDHIPPPPKRSCEYFDCAEFGRSLVHVQETLEDLEISINFYCQRYRFIDDSSKFRGIAGRLDTLRGFRKLQRLSMPTTLLSGWTPDFESFEKVEGLPAGLADILPIDSLVDLDLSDAMYNIFAPECDTASDDSSSSFPISSPPDDTDWERLEDITRDAMMYEI